jgi:hypothetical protein
MHAHVDAETFQILSNRRWFTGPLQRRSLESMIMVRSSGNGPKPPMLLMLRAAYREPLEATCSRSMEIGTQVTARPDPGLASEETLHDAQDKSS